jgi:hypothetical protein
MTWHKVVPVTCKCGLKFQGEGMVAKGGGGGPGMGGVIQTFTTINFKIEL